MAELDDKKTTALTAATSLSGVVYFYGVQDGVSKKFPISLLRTELGVIYDHDIPVILSGGKSFGKWVNGDTVDSTGKTPGQVQEEALADYLAPAITSLTASDLFKTFEVGEALPSGTTAVGYTISNFDNVKPPATGALSTNITGATFPTNPITLLSSGGFAINILANTRFTSPGTRTVTLQGLNTKNATFTATATITGLYKQFYGPVASAATNSSEVRALPSSRFTNAGSVFLLNTGSTLKTFQLWLPTGQTLTNVTDLDALNANLTSQYVASSLSVNDANGTPVTGTLYTMTQAVPYTTSHRHQITTS